MAEGTMELLTALLVLITGIYAYLTHRISRTSEESVASIRAQSEAMLRPYVSIYPFIRAHTPIINLKIENTGRTGAENLRLTMDKDFYQYGDTREQANLRTKNVFNSPIDSFAPGSQLIFSLAQGAEIFGQDSKADVTPVQFTITAEYEFFGKRVTETSRIDLRPFLGSQWESDPVVEELERIRKVLERKSA